MVNPNYNIDLLNALMARLSYTPEQRQYIINSLAQKDQSYLNEVLQGLGAKPSKNGTFGFSDALKFLVNQGDNGSLATTIANLAGWSPAAKTPASFTPAGGIQYNPSYSTAPTPTPQLSRGRGYEMLGTIDDATRERYMELFSRMDPATRGDFATWMGQQHFGNNFTLEGKIKGKDLRAAQANSLRNNYNQAFDNYMSDSAKLDREFKKGQENYQRVANQWNSMTQGPMTRDQYGAYKTAVGAYKNNPYYQNRRFISKDKGDTWSTITEKDWNALDDKQRSQYQTELYGKGDEIKRPKNMIQYGQDGMAAQAAPQQPDPQALMEQMQQMGMTPEDAQNFVMAMMQQDQETAMSILQNYPQIAQQMGAASQGGAPQVARNGAKLNYIKKLKGECPEGYEMTFFKAGGKVCKKCQKKVEKNCGGGCAKKACGGKTLKFHKEGGIMNNILSEIFAKGGAMNRNKHTAFGEERGANVVSTNHAGRWGGSRAFNANGTHNLNPHDKPNKFTAFGDEGKKKPTNVGLVGHKATGKTGRMQNRQKAGTTYKATAFGGEKQKRFHRGAKASSIGRIGSISGYPKGHGGKSGIGRI